MAVFVTRVACVRTMLRGASMRPRSRMPTGYGVVGPWLCTTCDVSVQRTLGYIDCSDAAGRVDGSLSDIQDPERTAKAAIKRPRLKRSKINFMGSA